MPARSRLLPLALATAVVALTGGTADAAGRPDPVPHGDDVAVAAPHGPSEVAAPTRLRAAAAAPRALVVPAAGRALPAAVDARPGYQPQVSCDPVDKPGAVALGRLLVDTYRAGTFGVSRMCNAGVTEHSEGRAVDWMLDANNPAQKAVADAALGWLTADNGENARRLGVQYLIWNRQSWRAYAPERGWQPYTGASPHTDHIHASLTWDGAMKRTSWWTGVATSPLDLGPCRVHAGQYAPLWSARRTGACPAALPALASPYPVTVIGHSGATVKIGQQALGLTADGVFGHATRNAVLAYQTRIGLPRTGVLDKATWASLVPVAAPPVAAPPPAPAPRPAPAPTPVQPVPVKKVPATVTTRLTPYKATRLAPGSTGPAVKALQGALKVTTSGRYDAATVAGVKALQKAWRLPVTGHTDLKTWNRAELTLFPWLGYQQTVVRPGATGPAVVALQKAMRVTADGRFGAKTQAAVMTIQARYGLRATGVVDAVTWRAVADSAPRWVAGLHARAVAATRGRPAPIDEP